jgi:hypothetical protein
VVDRHLLKAGAIEDFSTWTKSEEKIETDGLLDRTDREKLEMTDRERMKAWEERVAMRDFPDLSDDEYGFKDQGYEDLGAKKAYEIPIIA